ncbi:SDR family NAD(P)-dependent oxidoreductase [Xylophilus sp. ASV27]|uniref:SDR family NAD(P)-dependent oxidoreductase n=1 Tax=Xylophilus sp. ASV27 TaxID=2795129 RepID=UPI0018EAE4C5|nr:SDR family oxidoreductase [Xylophilus sp. ASV27]
MRLAKKVVVVSGGSQGIGEAIARRYAREGAHVAVVSSSSRPKAQAVVTGIEVAGGTARAYVCDVRDSRQVIALLNDVERDMGPVDILLNAAGVFYPTPAGATAEEDFDRMVDINFKGAWNMISAVAPGMKARRSGKIICLASVASVYGVAPFAVYCATKAAIVQLVRALALELAPYGVQINAISPGNTTTPMNEALRGDPATVEAIAAATPSGRAFSSVDDIAAVALFLASDDSRAMHGSCLLADEGISCGMAAH